MTTLFYADPELVIGLNRTIIFVNPNDLSIFKQVDLPESLPVEASSDAKSTEEHPDGENNENRSSSTAVKEPVRVQQVSYAPNRTLLAVTTSGQKSFLLYRCRPEHAWLVSTRALSRASSAITFSSNSELVLVTDKTGDCYLYNCVDMEAPPKLLLGHLSIVNDVLWSNCMKRIITCDRDDKIRVTNYPETHEIHGYCLGHKEFVSSIKFLSKNIIVSISGDKTLRIWDFENCKELAKIELPGPGIRFDVRYVDSTKFEVAILHNLDDCVSRYFLVKNEDGSWQSQECGVHKIDDFTACNVCLANGRLYVAGVLNEKFVLRTIPITPVVPVPEHWIEMVEECFKQYNWVPEDITTWFKKRYDNVSEYLERKKRRIEEKQK